MIHSLDESAAMSDDRLRSASSASLPEEKAPDQQQRPRTKGIMKKLGSLLHYSRRKQGRYGGDHHLHEQDRIDAGAKKTCRASANKLEADQDIAPKLTQKQKYGNKDNLDSAALMAQHSSDAGDGDGSQRHEDEDEQQHRQQEMLAMVTNEEQKRRGSRRSCAEREFSGDGGHSRKKSLSRVWQQVFCGGAQIMANGRAPIDRNGHGGYEDENLVADSHYSGDDRHPHTFFGIAMAEEASDEAYWLALADSILKHRQRQQQEGSTMGDRANDDADDGYQQLAQSKEICSTQQQSEDVSPSPFQKQAEIETERQELELEQQQCDGAEDDDGKKLPLILRSGGSTRLNTTLEESPCLLQSHQQRAGGGGSSRMVAAGEAAEQDVETGAGAEQEARTEAGTEQEAGAEQQQQPLQSFLLQEREGGRTSLMLLLHEEEQEEAAEEAAEEAMMDSTAEEGEEKAAEDPLLCCVCMVRRKGAALIPCGHTFCRTCATHLFSDRGSCPLCNHLIAQTLHIF